MRSLVFFLSFWTGLALQPLQAAQETTKIERIVIAYNTSNDWNSSNALFYQHLSRLLDAAKEKNVEVVFYPANGTSEEFKSNLRRLSQEKNTWVILSSHGGQITDSKGFTDTSLSFGDDVLVSDLQPLLGHKNVKGFLLSSCHAFSEVVSTLTPVNCGISPANSVGTSDEGRHYYNGLADLVRSKEAVDPVKVLRESIKSNIEKSELSKKILRSFNSRTGPDGQIEALVEGDSNQRYLFEGKGYKEVDHNGAPMVFCDGSDLFSKGNKFSEALKHYGNPKSESESTYKDSSPAPSRIGFLPETLVQPDLGIEANRYFTFPMDDLNLFGQKFYCGNNGKWTLKGSTKDQCYGLWVNVESCQIEHISKDVNWIGSTGEKIDCSWLRKFRNDLMARKVAVPENMCVSGCTIDSGFPGVQVFPGQCYPRGDGYRCPANLSFLSVDQGAGGIKDAKCCNQASKAHVQSLEGADLSCKPQCFDEISEKVVEKGACFYSGHEADNFVHDKIKYEKRGSLWGELKTAAAIEKTLSSPIWECNSSGRGFVSEECCLKAGRSWELSILGYGCQAPASIERSVQEGH